MPPYNNALDRRVMLILVVLCASWGLQQVTIKLGNEGISPVLQGGLRSVGSSILLLIWMSFRREPLFQRDGTLWWGIGVGILFSVEFILAYIGLEFTTASRSVVFLYTMPFFLTLGAYIFLPQETIGTWQIVGLICAFIGVGVAFSESLGSFNREILLGDALILISAFLWAVTTVLIKASPLASISASKALLYQIGISALLLPLASWLLAEEGIKHLPPVVIACVLYQSVWVAFVTYVLWFWLIRHYPASRLSSFTFLTPFFGVLFGAWIMHDPLTLRLMSALVLVGAGIYLVNTPASTQIKDT